MTGHRAEGFHRKDVQVSFQLCLGASGTAQPCVVEPHGATHTKKHSTATVNLESFLIDIDLVGGSGVGAWACQIH